MTKETNLTRRASLKLVGVLSALGTTAAIARESGYWNGGYWDDNTWRPGPSGLVLPHTATTSVDKVAELSQATLTNNLQTIMSAYSRWDTNEVILWANPDGTLTLKTTFNLAEVEQHVASVLSTAQYPGGELRNSDLPGRWFDLLDSQYKSIDLASGVETTYRAAFLFITWPDGVIGQIYWREPSWTPAFNVTMPETLIHKLTAYEDAWRSGDVDARLAQIEDQTCSVVRIASVTGNRRSRFVARTKADLRAGWTSESAGRVIEFERLYRVISTFYISAGYKFVLDVGGKLVVRETAVIFPLGPNRKFIGELSYSLES
jgi:hypothetical protein